MRRSNVSICVKMKKDRTFIQFLVFIAVGHGRTLINLHANPTSNSGLTEPFLFAAEQRVGNQKHILVLKCFFSVGLLVKRSKLEGICSVTYNSKHTEANPLYLR